MLEYKGEENFDRISYGNQVRRATVASLKLARAETSYEMIIFYSSDPSLNVLQAVNGSIDIR